jgi:hypothetical protein
MIPVVVCGLTSLAAGVDVTLQNDSNAGFTPCQCFIPGEQAAAWLTSPCAGDVTEVQIGWGSPFGGAPDQLEMEIHIYRSGVFPSPGAEITNGELVGPILVDGIINQFDATAINATVAANETIVVSLEFLNTSSPPVGPGILYDGDGCQLGKNTAFAIPGGWADACLLGVTGDWVIRAVVDCASCPWDCDGSNDGAVGVTDFLALLAEWGQVGTACDFDGAGVGITDFLKLLASWGPCP